MTILLDSNILIDALRGDARQNGRLAAWTRAGFALTTTAINLGEVYAGVRRGEEARTDGLLSCLAAIAITPEMGIAGGKLVRAWATRGRTITLADATLAAVALAGNLALATANRKDFPMPELQFAPD